MSDLSILRFARKSWYGVATASGMFLGHYVAWIAASLLYALQLHNDPPNTSVLPGPLAYRACGVAGLVCVILAGWTTANPTIYRAGLAFQAIVPWMSRAKVTFAAGLIATIAGMFPAIAMKLLDFVALYGLLLMPMGAIIFVDFYLLPKFDLRSNFTELGRDGFNWAAGLTWLLTLVACWAFVAYAGKDKIFFAGLPGWFVAAALYVALSKLYQRPVLA
jgi:purine-cytosine permease-like protein